MRKLTLFTLTFLISGLVLAQNTLLQSPATGTPAIGPIMSIEMAANAQDVVLICGDYSKTLYAIDIADNNPADAAQNTVTEIPNFTTLVSAALGKTVTVVDFEVNPISKAVYVLCRDQNGGSMYVAVVKNNGLNITALDLTNITYSAIQFTDSNLVIQDMAWGDALYVSAGGYGLDNELNRIPVPFVHNSKAEMRATAMFKSNWGNSYMTDAPLERMAYLNINGEHRLAGVTLCAPGFTMQTSKLADTGILEIEEHFDMGGGLPYKVVSVKQNNTYYLFDLHMGWPTNKLARIGQKYIDGSRIDENQYNQNAQALQDFNGPTPGLTEEDIKIYPGGYVMIAFMSNDELLALDDTDKLKSVSIAGPNGIAQSTPGKAALHAYPNPAEEYVTIEVQDRELASGHIVLHTITGKEVLNQPLNNELSQRIILSSLDKGPYILSLVKDNKTVHAESLIVK